MSELNRTNLYSAINFPRLPKFQMKQMPRVYQDAFKVGDVVTWRDYGSIATNLFAPDVKKRIGKRFMVVRVVHPVSKRNQDAVGHSQIVEIVGGDVMSGAWLRHVAPWERQS
jgi:hypothetical protein